MKCHHVCVVLAIAMLGAGEAAHGQKVEVRASSTEAFVGESLTVQVEVVNMSRQTVPNPPETKDFEITHDPTSVSSSTQSHINLNTGRRTESVTYTHFFQVRPLRTGRLVLPPFSVNYRGLVFHTKQIPIRVTQDTSSDYLFCEIKTDPTSAYVGQAVDLTLEVWVRQFRQRDFGLLDAGSMWNLRDMRATSVGVFDDVDWNRPRYREATRRTEEGDTEKHYVFILETTVHATKAGPLDFGNVAVAYRYPKRLGRGNSLIFRRWEIEDSRRLRAVAKTPHLEIKPIPTEGRPADYNGAIGRHRITARARPTEVPVGDPITLTLSITGSGPLERLSPPKLDQVPALTRDFEISSDSLAGEIRGNHKVFSQTIRALHEDVTEIPPIPLSYFDPDRERFETEYSKPIPIAVKPAERLALPTMSEIGRSAAVLVPLVEATEGLLANETDPAALLADQSGGLGPASWTLLAVMPALYVLTWFMQRRSARYRDDAALKRRSRAYAAAKKALRGGDAAASPEEVRNALIGYIADRCKLPAGGLTRADAVRLITERGAPDDAVRAVDALLGSLEQAEYGGGSGGVPQDGAAEAKRLVDALVRCRRL